MITTKPLGAIILVVVALFFLLYGQCAVSIVQPDRHQSLSMANQYRPESNILGDVAHSSNNYLCCAIGTKSSQRSIQLSSTNSIGILDLAVVFANITSDGQYMIAIYNDSLLNAKFAVYILATDNITVNGIYQPIGATRLITAPFPSMLKITNGTLHYVIRLRQINSLDDIEDSDRPVNNTAKFYELDLVKYSIAGIPATLSAIATWIAILVLLKSQKVQEGLPDEQ